MKTNAGTDANTHTNLERDSHADWEADWYADWNPNALNSEDATATLALRRRGTRPARTKLD